MIRLLLIAGLAGCSMPRTAPPATPTGAKCAADGLTGLIGKAATPALVADARQRSGARTTRVIAPGTMVTMDYREDRLNIETDDKSRTTKFRCG